MENPDTTISAPQLNTKTPAPAAPVDAAAAPEAAQSIDMLKATKDRIDITKDPSNEHTAAAVGFKTETDTIEQAVLVEAAVPQIATVLEVTGLTERMSISAKGGQSQLDVQKVRSTQLQSDLTIKESVEKTDITEANIQEISCPRTTHTPSSYDGSRGKMNKLRDQMSNIFPIGTMGCKDNTVIIEQKRSENDSKRFLDAQEASLDCVGHMESTPRKRPSSCKPTNGRNPLTGYGLDGSDVTATVEDEAKKGGYVRRKDGNPVLGVGYGTNGGKEDTATRPTGRVPPGGHSAGLW